MRYAPRMKILGVLGAVLALGACGKSDKGGGSARGGGAGDTEAQIELNHMGQLAKRFYVEHAAFPAGTEAPTPAQACCSQPGKVCKALASDWNGATAGHPWSDLSFTIAEDGFKYQYSYTGGGDTFTATAVGDPDCDGHPITLTLSGSSQNGNPTTAVMVEKK